MSWREDAIKHAEADYPREACGLVVVFKGRERYMPCRNLAGADQFRMCPEDYAAAEDKGEVVRVFHSHPDAFAEPSEVDRVQCEATGLPWSIVAVRDAQAQEWAEFEPCGYEAPLVGRKFVHGTHDCYGLIRDWYAAQGVELPDFERADEWWKHGENLYMDNFAAAGFEPVTDGVREGDIFLMQVDSTVANHAAVYIGEGLILHHLYGRLSSRDVYGGYWADCTRLRVRRKEVIE